MRYMFIADVPEELESDDIGFTGTLASGTWENEGLACRNPWWITNHFERKVIPIKKLIDALVHVDLSINDCLYELEDTDNTMLIEMLETAKKWLDNAVDVMTEGEEFIQWFDIVGEKHEDHK